LGGGVFVLSAVTASLDLFFHTGDMVAVADMLVACQLACLLLLYHITVTEMNRQNRHTMDACIIIIITIIIIIHGITIIIIVICQYMSL